MSDRDDTPSEAELLLPWHHTGRLCAEETAMVEAWLASHPEARRHLAFIAEEREGAIGENETAPTPRAGAVDRLMARVAAEPRRHSASLAARLLGRLGGWLAAMTPEMRGGLAAAVVALVVVQGAAIGFMAGREPAMFEAASSGTSTAVEGEVLVSFAPGAMMNEISAMLGALNARIVDGPRADGLFVLSIPEGADPQEVVDTLAARADIVTFAAIGSAD